MRRACFLEVFAGSFALLLGSTAAFVLSGGHYSRASVVLFVVISTLLLLAAACALFLRVAAYDRRAARQLYNLLPAEVTCRLKPAEHSDIGVEHLIFLAGNHLKAQQALLDEQYQGLFSPQALPSRIAINRAMGASENTWQQLRSELSALEDQFSTDMQPILPRGPFSGLQ